MCDFICQSMRNKTTIPIGYLTFISATSCQGWFWINPRFMFKGYRSKLVELQDNLKYSNE